MKIIKCQSLLFFLLLISFVDSTAQVNDARLWLTAGVEKKLTKKIAIEGKAAFRLNENITEVGSYNCDLGVGYKLLKRLKISAHYRFSGKSNLNNSFSKRHRYYLDLNYKIKTVTPFSANIRVRYQKQYSDVLSNESGNNPANTLRGELLIAYNYKRYEPFISSELYYLMDNSGKYFNRIRYKVGVDYEMNKRNSFTLFYMIQQELNSENPVRAFIVGLGYKYTL